VHIARRWAQRGSHAGNSGLEGKPYGDDISSKFSNSTSMMTRYTIFKFQVSHLLWDEKLK
jgi:hypothetical protein